MSLSYSVLALSTQSCLLTGNDPCRLSSTNSQPVIQERRIWQSTAAGDQGSRRRLPNRTGSHHQARHGRTVANSPCRHRLHDARGLHSDDRRRRDSHSAFWAHFAGAARHALQVDQQYLGSRPAADDLPCRYVGDEGSRIRTSRHIRRYEDATVHRRGKAAIDPDQCGRTHLRGTAGGLAKPYHPQRTLLHSQPLA